MSQIIKQPDGKFAVFSNVSDMFIMTDATAGEVATHFALEAVRRVSEDVERKLKQIEADDKPYGQFTMTYAEAKRIDKRTRKGTK